jgi:hypothetical protein
MRYWIKLYTEILSDPKIGRLSDRQFRTCISLFALAGVVDQGGIVGTLTDIAWRFHMAPGTLTKDLATLADVGIVEERDGQWIVRKWAERQAKAPSDQPDQVLKRVHEHRERKRNETVTALHDERNDTQRQRQSTDTETEKNREETETETEVVTPRDPAWAQAVTTFENEISLVSGTIAPDMLDMWALLQANNTPAWWTQAIAVAVANNRRSWSYVRGILSGCLAEGHPPMRGANGTGKKARQTGTTTIMLPDGTVTEAKL